MLLPWQACNADLVQPAELQLQVHHSGRGPIFLGAGSSCTHGVNNAGQGGRIPAHLLLVSVDSVAGPAVRWVPPLSLYCFVYNRLPCRWTMGWQLVHMLQHVASGTSRLHGHGLAACRWPAALIS